MNEGKQIDLRLSESIKPTKLLTLAFWKERKEKREKKMNWRYNVETSRI